MLFDHDHMMSFRSRLIVAALLGAALAACESPLSPNESLALAQAEARWATRGFKNYAIETRQACFCPPEVTQWARVEVVSDSVARVILLESGAEVPADPRGRLLTVERGFREIPTANDQDWLKDVVARFNPELGFPTQVDFVPKPGILDAGGAYYLRNA